MSQPVNILQQVQTYNRANLGLLTNYAVAINLANKKFKDFQNIGPNLGSTVTFDKPPLFTTVNSLVASFQPLVQRTQTLTVNQEISTSYAYTAQQDIFNIDKATDSYMQVFGRSAVAEIGNRVEANVLRNIISDVRNSSTGLPDPLSGPYRFFGNGRTAINSYQQLAQSVTDFRNTGMPPQDIKYILPDTSIPSIIGSGLNQFAPRRNDDIANSWELGSFGTPAVTYYESNLLPVHYAGNVGNDNTTLTVVSTTVDADGGISAITFSGAGASDADAIYYGDSFQFSWGVSGQPNLYAVMQVGHNVSAQPVQFRATANAQSNGGGQVTVSIFPKLYAAAGQNQNINYPIAAGMQCKVLPSHRAGVIIGGDALFLAMPRLNNQDPYPTSNESDPVTGVSMRMTYGSVLGQNQQVMIHDAIWGSTLVPEYSMKVAFPL